MGGRKVYGSLSSPPTLRVLASLYEHQLHFQFLHVDLHAGQHKKLPFLSLNPFGQIPAFQDEDLTLFESRTIMRYIAFNYPKLGKEHIFKDPLIQGVVAGWIDIEDHKFNPPASKLIDELVLFPKHENDMVPSNLEVVAKEIEKLSKVLDVYEKRLGKSKYLGGEKFTSADLTHLPALFYLMKIPMVKQLFESRPCVDGWCMRIMARPAWIQVLKFINKNDTL